MGHERLLRIDAQLQGIPLLALLGADSKTRQTLSEESL